MRFTAAGDVGDYPESVRDGIAARFAAETGVPMDQVVVIVTAASVSIAVSITTHASNVESIQTKLAPHAADTASLTSFLAPAVSSMAILRIDEPPVADVPPSPPPTPPPLRPEVGEPRAPSSPPVWPKLTIRSTGSQAMTGETDNASPHFMPMLIVSVVAGVVILVLVAALALLFWRLQHAKRALKASEQRTKPSFTSAFSEPSGGYGNAIEMSRLAAQMAQLSASNVHRNSFPSPRSDPGGSSMLPSPRYEHPEYTSSFSSGNRDSKRSETGSRASARDLVQRPSPRDEDVVSPREVDDLALGGKRRSWSAHEAARQSRHDTTRI